MVEWYKRYRFLDNWSKRIIDITMVYVICALILVVAHKNGYVLLGDGGVSFWIEGSSANNVWVRVLEALVSGVLAGVGLSFVLLQQGLLSIVCIFFFTSYWRVFTSKEKQVDIIAQSRSQKLRYRLKILAVSFLLYFITSIMVAYVTGEFKNIMDAIESGLITNFLLSKGNVIAILFIVMIVDIDCKNSALDEGANWFWNIITLIASGFMYTFLLFIWGYISASNSVLVIIIIFVLCVELKYILRNIDKLKIR